MPITKKIIGKQKAKNNKPNMIPCNPILIHRTRGETIESFHRGVICMVNKEGKIIYSAGNILQICYPRSALKFFQQIPLIETGCAQKLKLTDAEIAVACGSHSGEKMHLQAVRSILKKAGLQENDLQCGAHYPFDETTKTKLIQKSAPPKPIHNNCSGKHAAFLALTKYLGYATQDYLNQEHPIQQRIRQIVAEMHECNEAELETNVHDGCSAPMFALSIQAQAIAYKNLCVPKQFNTKRQAACKKLIHAALKHPEMIGGTKRYCTEIIQAGAGNILGKTGAEGVYSFALPTLGIGCTLKIDDGASGLQYHVAQKILEELRLFKKETFDFSIHQERIIRNWNGHVTGRIVVANQRNLWNIKLTIG